ncbi:MAG: sigma 54-interacting transcriptional regulator [Gammaproteobacteria bacterium]
MTNSEIDQELQEIKDDYLTALPVQFKEIQQQYLQAQTQPHNRKLIEDLRLLTHRMRGTSAMYGFLKVSDSAAKLEELFNATLRGEGNLREFIQEQLEMLERSIDDVRKHPVKTPATSTSDANGHLLVVDDDPDFLRLTAKLLMQQGFRVTTATDPDKVLQLMAEGTPELLLIDVEMPLMSGYELCKRVRHHEQGQALPVIFLTAHNNLENRIAAFQAGGDDFINKPLVMEELMARVGVRLARARLAQEKQAMLDRLQYQQQALLTILDQLQIGTIIIDADGKIIFMSESCSSLGGLNPEQAVGQAWQLVLPFDKESLQHIERQLQQREENSSRIYLHWIVQGKHYWGECEVREVPATPGQHLLYLYDKSEVQRLRRQIEQSRFGQMIGDSEPMRQMYSLIERVARGDWTVLIEGETGVGKELVAHSIHAASPRKDGPFIAVNSAGLSESLLTSQLFGHRRGAFTGAVADQQGFFEAASGGTLFLDEIGDLPLSMQAALLRVLQEKEITRVGESKTRKVDVRVIVATHKDLSSEVREGRFREDLLYRLRVARIYVPALRERRSDIALLAQTFLGESCRTAGKQVSNIADEAMRRLQNYDWPGNVRELKATLDYALIRCSSDPLLAEDLPPELSKPRVETLAPIEGDERTHILTALHRAGGNRTEAARLLGISRATFYRRLGELKIALSDE